jgi:hypothetical protein
MLQEFHGLLVTILYYCCRRHLCILIGEVDNDINRIFCRCLTFIAKRQVVD